MQDRINAALKYCEQEQKNLENFRFVSRDPKAKGLPDIGELTRQAWFDAFVVITGDADRQHTIDFNSSKSSSTFVFLDKEQVGVCIQLRQVCANQDIYHLVTCRNRSHICWQRGGLMS